MTYSWQTDFAGSYALACRFMALRLGSRLPATLPEMYYCESYGVIP